MTVSELIKELQNYDEDAKVILVWDNYQRRKITGSHLIRPGLVELNTLPKTES